MASEDEVKKFLKEFQALAKVFDMIIINRDKNTKALLELGISPNIRKDIIMTLKVDNYYRGPSEDRKLPQNEVWEFGAELEDGQEVYIKLSCRREQSRGICLSFHPPEHEITYPFRPDKKKSHD